MENIKLNAKQDVIFTGSKVRRNENRRFTVGSVESFNADTVERFRKPVEEDLATTRKRGHDTAWVIPEACVIVDSKSYPGYYEEQDRLRAASVRVPVSATVEVEGRLYRVIDEPNDNIGLKEIKG